jgi:hypothetical protein
MGVGNLGIEPGVAFFRHLDSEDSRRLGGRNGGGIVSLLFGEPIHQLSGPTPGR